MADIEEALRNILVNNSPVNTIVSGRVYPLRTPDNGTFPSVSYTRVSSRREHTMDAAGNLTFSLFQLDIWAAKQTGASGGAAQARDLARKVQTALDGYRGTVAGIDIQGILSDNETQSWEPEIEIYRVIQQYTVIHREG